MNHTRFTRALCIFTISLAVAVNAAADTLRRALYTITLPSGYTIDPPQEGVDKETLTEINFPDGGFLVIFAAEDVSGLPESVDVLARSIAAELTMAKMVPPSLSKSNDAGRIEITGTANGQTIRATMRWFIGRDCFVVTTASSPANDQNAQVNLQEAVKSLVFNRPADERERIKGELRRQVAENAKSDTARQEQAQRLAREADTKVKAQADRTSPHLPAPALGNKQSSGNPAVTQPTAPQPGTGADADSRAPKQRPVRTEPAPGRGKQEETRYIVPVLSNPTTQANSANHSPGPTQPPLSPIQRLIEGAGENGVAQEGISAAITSSRYCPPLEKLKAAYESLGRPTPSELRSNPAYNTYLASLIASGMLTVPQYKRERDGYNAAINFVKHVSDQQINELQDFAIQGAIYRYRNTLWEQKFGRLSWKDSQGREVAVSEFLRRTKDYEKLREIYLIASRHE